METKQKLKFVEKTGIILKNTFQLVLGVMLAVTYAPIVMAASDPSVAVGTVSGQAGTNVVLNVSFVPGNVDVSALQFDLPLPAGVTFVSAVAGTAATSASKDAAGAAITGGVRVLVYGMNQNVIGGGSIAQITLNISASATAGAYTVTPTGMSASDPYGTELPLSGTPGSVTVGASTATVPVIASFSASPASITSGLSSILSWQVSGAASLSINNNVGDVTGFSNKTVSPVTTTIFTLTATNAAGSVTSQATVTVTTSTATPIAGDFNLDHIVNSVDYSLLNSHWFQTSNIGTYDLQQDGIVNSLDFAIFKSNWGKTW